MPPYADGHWGSALIEGKADWCELTSPVYLLVVCSEPLSSLHRQRKERYGHRARSGRPEVIGDD